MLTWFLNRRIDAAEREMGVSLDYVREIARTSPRALWRMFRFVRLAQFRSSLPPSAMHVAVIAGSLVDDCGSCVQIGVNLARKEGVSPEILRAVLRRDVDGLPDELRDVYTFAETITSGHDVDDELRERLRARFGERGYLDLCQAIALHRVYPTLKRALGHAKSCSLVAVEV